MHGTHCFVHFYLIWQKKLDSQAVRGILLKQYSHQEVSLNLEEPLEQRIVGAASLHPAKIRTETIMIPDISGFSPSVDVVRLVCCWHPIFGGVTHGTRPRLPKVLVAHGASWQYS